jgi:hypothetical protein
LWQVGSNSFPHHWHLCSVPIPYILRFSSSLLHYTAFFFSCVGSYLFFAYCHPRFRTFEIQASGHQKTAPQRGFLSEYLFYIHRMALPCLKDAKRRFEGKKASIYAGLHRYEKPSY